MVLLDIILEKKDGTQALKDIIAIKKDAKVIMVSAVGQEAMVKEAMAAGATEFIAKPFDGGKVIGAVKKALG
ncbi:MAG: response regulator [Candidatus Woesearchaeota archaeon]